MMPDVPGDTDDATRAPPRKPAATDFLFGKLLGEGSYSHVYLAKDVKTDKEYAIKVCDKEHILKEKKKDAILRERDILSQLCKKPSPYVIELHCTFHDDRRLYFVITHAKNGDLLKYIHKVGNFNMECTRFYSGEIICALDYLHKAGVVHRDLKPENILVSESMHIMLTDFGSAKILKQATDSTSDESESFVVARPIDETDATKKQPVNADSSVENVRYKAKRNSFVGTAHYVSPEVLNDNTNITPAVDLWALGCIIYQLVSGLPPFRSLTKISMDTMSMRAAEYQIFQSILKLDYSFPEDFDADARHVVESLLKLKPAERASIVDLQKDRFFSGMDFDKLIDQTPPTIVPYLVGPEEPQWDLVSNPGLDEQQMGRLWGLRLGDDPEVKPSATTASTSKPVQRGIMDPTTEEREQLMEEQRAKNKWHRFVEGNLILKYGMVDKKKGLFPRRRMLLLTTGPHLYYVDPEKMVRKGEIPWSQSLSTEPKNFKTFFVHTPNRTYNLEDPEGYALRWCKAINDLHELTYGPKDQSSTT